MDLASSPKEVTGTGELVWRGVCPGLPTESSIQKRNRDREVARRVVSPQSRRVRRERRPTERRVGRYEGNRETARHGKQPGEAPCGFAQDKPALLGAFEFDAIAAAVDQIATFA